MAAPTRTRLASIRSFARAVRAASRPGSPGLAERVACVPRLVAAVRRGEYLGASGGQLLSVLAAAAYVASPADLVPEVLLGPLGLGDDAMAVAFLATAFVNLTGDYLAWESGARGRDDTRPRPSARPASRETVQGRVVR